jgi:hypothetical protein
VPLNVSATADAAAGTVTLSWVPNPRGTAPMQYRVYASDEKGFSVSGTEYKVRMGRGFCKDMAEFQAKKEWTDNVPTPANFLATTTERVFTVVGPALDLANANRCFYRVVAVDAQGLRSGPSDYAEAPRPFVCTRPPAQAATGQALAYQPGVLRSLGDFRCKGGYNGAFWDREELTFALTKAPAWLAVDPQTGKVTGTPGPDAAGKHAVVLKVSNSRGGTAEQAFDLEVVRAP